MHAVLARALCFSTFGLGGIVLALTVLPAAHLWPGRRATRAHRARRVIHHSFRFFVWLMRVTGCIELQIKGGEQLAGSRGQLVVANHPSLIDVVILIAQMPDYCCIVKRELWQNPFIGGVVRWTGYISNADSAALLTQCEAVLDAGISLLVFPEGTRTKNPEQLKFKRGAANIATRCGVDIIPASIRVSPPTLRKGEAWNAIPATRPVFAIEVHPVIALDSIIDPNIEPSLATRRLNTHLLDFYQGLLNHG